MNLDSLTPPQRAAVEHVAGPLLVSAGAGSGKTFMLTQRIAYALLNPDVSGVADIDQVLAITFTELAASEIKARVRAKLREEGLADQALKVDACWISTIHGMCSRILHEHALELGLDPTFGLLDETDKNALQADCLDAALAEKPYRALAREYETAGGRSHVAGMVGSLLGAASCVRGGLDALVWADAPSPHDLACALFDEMQACDAVAREGIGTNGKAKETFTVNARDALEDPASGMPAVERLMARKDLAYRDVALAIAGVSMDFGSRTRKEPYATAYARLRVHMNELAQAAFLGMAQPARDELLALARRVHGLMEAGKRERNVLDQDDLLLKTLDAFENNPAVAERYRDRFRLVMVDEFQDTSGLQIALISHLTGGDQRLCTVGDTQQSIYRFRGADVDTYRAHKAHMRELEKAGTGLCLELDKNFRSHGDVIEFVNRVFDQEQVFGAGGEFIRLDHDRTHGAHNPFPDVERIQVHATTYGQGARLDDARAVEAETIARAFGELHANEANRRWGDMVILLGGMSNADLYADTLRAHGIPCVITGGSGFVKTPEAQFVLALVRALANPLDDEALRAALTGPAFGLGTDELLRLATAPDGRRRGLWRGLGQDGAADPSPRTRLAARVLGECVARGGSLRVQDLLCEVLVTSGWLDRLQDQGPQGMASAANALKAVRLAAAAEGDAATPRRLPAVAARLATKFAEGLKDNPGSLAAEGQDAVRILTIHASKGLEFPIVALAAFYGLRANTEALVLDTVGDHVYLALKPGLSVKGDERLKDLLAKKLVVRDTHLARLAEAGEVNEPAELGTPGLDAVELLEAIRAHAGAEELGELRRKFYVGATRPREALIVAACASENKDRTYRDVVDDLRSGLFGDDDFTTAPEGVAFGGERRALVRRTRLARSEDGTLLVDDVPAAQYLCGALYGSTEDSDGSQSPEPGCREALESVPEPPGPGEFPLQLAPAARPCNPLRAGTFSYSALMARGAGDGLAPCDPDELPESAGASGAEKPTGPAAAASQGGAAMAAASRHASPAAFGSALHQLCQLMAEEAGTRDDGAPKALSLPSEARISAVMRTWDLTPGAHKALVEALGRWAGSSVAREACAHPRLLAEAPFCAMLAGSQGEPVHLEGTVDLLAMDPGRAPGEQAAFLVDYKTGGSPAQKPDELERKHRLQAMCYAYAVLSQGYAAVEERFVRVQVADPANPGEPQVVRYRFEAADRQRLGEAIATAYARV